MSLLTRPKVMMESADLDTSPIEATLMTDGRIRIKSDPYCSPIGGSWFTPAEIREFATELLGLADASDAIYGDCEER